MIFVRRLYNEVISVFFEMEEIRICVESIFSMLGFMVDELYVRIWVIRLIGYRVYRDCK